MKRERLNGILQTTVQVRRDCRQELKKKRKEREQIETETETDADGGTLSVKRMPGVFQGPK